MTKKDYALVASILYEANRHMNYSAAQQVLQHACAILKKDNPNFKERVFCAEVALPTSFIKKTLREQ